MEGWTCILISVLELKVWIQLFTLLQTLDSVLEFKHRFKNIWQLFSIDLFGAYNLLLAELVPCNLPHNGHKNNPNGFLCLLPGI